jgi:hypothetical protein
MQRRAVGADVEIQELAVPADPGDDAAAELGDVRLVGLEHGDRRDIGPLDDTADRPLAQECGERLDLGKFGHNLDSACTRGQGEPRPGPAPAHAGHCTHTGHTNHWIGCLIQTILGAEGA